MAHRAGHCVRKNFSARLSCEPCDARVLRWIVALEFEKSGIGYKQAKTVLKQFDDIILKVKGDHDNALPFEDTLLPSDDPYLHETLLAHQKNPTDEREQTGWQEKFILELRKKGVTWSQLQAPPSVLPP